MIFEVEGLAQRVADRALFEGIDLRLSSGWRFVMGPSGRGKTQLLLALADLRRPAAGRVTLDGHPPAAYAPGVWRRRVCYVPQLPPSLPGAPEDLIQEVARLRHHGAWARPPLEWAQRWGLETLATPWARMSGGERQRALLAIAVARDPDVLLLDEPTSALDVDTARRVEADLAGRCGVWVTHDPDAPTRLGGEVLSL
ncbi:ABC transporter ATP-binding protein [Myxococcota bacterium]|nr:ABC transporter ATP-binding protein [Myxococcota bacterium]MBU1429439.1 ABC transporter ATP-binding protein [Myxococcota bacterium]MBU1897727.1 ABC transporter ATP-binding protein [Myxococcota bacterium]